MTQAKLKPTAEASSAARLLNANLRALAPRLISYQCELSTLISAVTADEQCAAALIRFANKRKTETDADIDSVHHAVIFIGLIDVKQFLFAYLLLNTETAERPHLNKLLVRAKITSALFRTNGPLNKDLAFVATLLTSKKYLRIAKTESIWMLFKMNIEQSNAIKNLDFGLRDTLKQTLVIEAKADPKSANRAPLTDEVHEMYKEAVYWANSVLTAIG